jgi:hypothetical protein
MLATLPVIGTVSGDEFGAAVAADGSAAIAGSRLDDLPGKADVGSARIFRVENGAWTLEATLLPPTADQVAKNYFGASVAIAGDLAVVGSPGSDVAGADNAGVAYVFRRVAGTWTLEATLARASAAANDKFGTAVATIGDFIAVGAPGVNVGTQYDTGAVTVHRLDAGVWTATATITPAAPAAGDELGFSLAFGGPAATPVLAMGAPGDDEGSAFRNCGAVHVVTLDATGVASTAVRLLGSPLAKDGKLGTSVSLDAAGTRLAAGAPFANRTATGLKSGTVMVWSFDGTAWTGVEVRPPDLVAGENFGSSVSLRADGLALVAGSPLDVVGGVNGRGSAAVFTFGGTAWSIHDRIALPAGGTGGSNFGRAVAFHGLTILVGAPKHTPPAGGTLREFDGP